MDCGRDGLGLFVDDEDSELVRPHHRSVAVDLYDDVALIVQRRSVCVVPPANEFVERCWPRSPSSVQRARRRCPTEPASTRAIYGGCPDPADKRRNVITITELGESRLAELDRVLDGVNNHIMPRSTRMNARSCLFLLNRINAHLAVSGGTGLPCWKAP